MSGERRYDHQGLRRAIALVFVASGADDATSNAVADMLIEANLSGHDSHGIQMVKHYLEGMHDDGMRLDARPELIHDGEAVLRIDGHLALGALTGAFAMEHGIAAARQHGVALVALANSHHLGRIGYWAERCLQDGLASLHFVNVHGHRPLVAAWGGRQARLGTNPVCIGVPGTDATEPFVLDMATSKIAFGKVGVAYDKDETLPDGAMISKTGEMTRDPATMIEDEFGGALLSMGEHKGGGLAVVCELLAGALAGNRTMVPERQHANTIINGMLLIIIDPDALGGFDAMKAEIDGLYGYIRSSEPMAGHDRVLIAGEPERLARADRLEHGVPLADAAWADFVEAAASRGVAAADLEQAVGTS